MKNEIEIPDIYDFINKFPEAIDYIKNPDDKVLKIQKQSSKDKFIINELRSGKKWGDFSYIPNHLIETIYKEYTLIGSSNIIRNSKEYLYKNKDILEKVVISHLSDFVCDAYQDLFINIDFDLIYNIIKKAATSSISIQIRRDKEKKIKLYLVSHFWGYAHSYDFPYKKFTSDDFDVIFKNEKSFRIFICRKMDILLMFSSVPAIVQEYIFEKHYKNKDYHYLLTDPLILKKVSVRNIIK